MESTINCVTRETFPEGCRLLYSRVPGLKLIFSQNKQNLRLYSDARKANPRPETAFRLKSVLIQMKTGELIQEEEEGGIDQERESMEMFLKWGAELGISDAPESSRNPTSCLGRTLAVSQFSLAGGRGLGAVRNLRNGELILKVPRHALMTRESISKNHNLAFALDHHPSLSSTQILSVCLLYEMAKGKNSLWYPYLMHLPRESDILATFGEFEKQALQVDDAIWVAEKAILKSEAEWKEASALMSELKLKPKLQTFRAWLWASATISSRTLHIPWDSAGCLCPVGDLFNYDAPGGDSSGRSKGTESLMHTSYFQVSSLPIERDQDTVCTGPFEAQSQRLTDGGYEDDCAAYCFYARRNYKKGEQVLLSYGTYTNLELLEHYGFVLDQNPNEKVFISLELGMYSLVSSWPRDSLYIHHDGRPSFALSSALRLWAIPQKQRKFIGHLVYSGSQISAENETSVMKWISKKCEIILKGLPTSIDEDRALLLKMDKIQDSEFTVEQQKTDVLGYEFCEFLEANCPRNENNGCVLEFSRKVKTAMNKWRLAVQWRLRYKGILADCVSYCNGKTVALSATGVSSIRA